MKPSCDKESLLVSPEAEIIHDFFFSLSKSCIHSKRKHSHNKMVEATLNVVKFKVRAKYYRKVSLTRG